MIGHITRFASWLSKAIGPQGKRRDYRAYGKVESESLSYRMGLGRLELPTSRLSGVRSNHLSYRPQNHINRLLQTYYEDWIAPSTPGPDGSGDAVGPQRTSFRALLTL